MPRSLIEQYEGLIEKHNPGQSDAADIHTIDQNIAVLREYAGQLNLNLDDPFTLQTVVLAHILSIAFTMAHIEASCKGGGCFVAAAKHTQSAAGQLGGLFKEIQKNL